MARLWSSGAELNTSTANAEVSGVIGTGTSIVTSIVRSGTYAYRTTLGSASTTAFYYNYKSSDTQGVFNFRFYLYITTLPSANTRIFTSYSQGGLSDVVTIMLTTGGALQLAKGITQIGSDSTTLSTSTWYQVELSIDTTTLASSALNARLSGTSFASGTTSLSNATSRIRWGIMDSATADLRFDDIAINDSSGSFQNSYPGAGKIIHLKPNAAGDNSDWTNTYTNVDEVTPNDATDLVSSNTLNQIDDHNIESPVVLGDSDTINAVQVGVRFNGVGASANASFVLRIKAAASGTVEESSSITPADATWVTNAAASPRNYSLTLYDLPGASTTAWTKADLEVAQIGYRLSTASTNAAQISTVWLLVDFTFAASPTSYVGIADYYSVRQSGQDATIPGVTVASGDNAIIVLTSVQDSNHTNYPLVTVTRDGQSFTKIIHYEPAGNVRVEAWYLASPNTGTANITTDNAGAVAETTASAFVLRNADTSSLIDNYNGGSGSGFAGSVSLTSTVDGDLLLHILCAEADTTAVGTDQVIIADWQDQSYENSMISYKYAGTSGSESMSASMASGQPYAQIALAIKTAAAGGGASFAYFPQRMRSGMGI